MRRLFVFIIFLFVAIGLVNHGLRAQDNEKSRLISFVENQLSTDNRRISLNGLEGALSSDVTLENITIADADGIWLKIQKPALKWSRTSLLRGRLEIESLTAEQIDVFRKPEQDESAPTPEAQPFTIPELPIAVRLNELDVKRVSFGETVFGLKSDARVFGRLLLEDGGLDTKLQITRLGETSGAFEAAIAYAPDTENIDIDVTLNEPENGILATALQLEGSPPVELTIQGKAPLSNLAVNLDLDVDQKNILDGNLTLSRLGQNLQAKLNASGPIATLLSPQYQTLLGERSELVSNVLIANDGRLVLENFDLKSGTIRVEASATRRADRFLSALKANISMQDGAGGMVKLPGEAARFDKATVAINYDGTARESWTAVVDINSIDFDDVKIANFHLNTNGFVKNIANPAVREVSFETNSGAINVSAADKALEKAIGDTIAIAAKGNWRAGHAFNLQALNLIGDTIKISANGTLDNLVFDGHSKIALNNLKAFAPVAKRNLSGQASLAVRGKVEPVSGIFDLVLTGETNALTIGNERLDKLLAKTTRLNGGIARSQAGLSFDQLQISSDDLSVEANGTLSSNKANISARGLLRDIAVINAKSKGAVALSFTVEGEQKPFETKALFSMEDGRLLDRAVEGLSFSLSGRTNGSDFSGVLSGDGLLNERSINASGDIVYTRDELNISDLAVDLAGTTLSGDLIIAPDGSSQGRLDVASPDISNAAALALIEASGQLEGTISLASIAQSQSISLSAQVNNLQIEQNNISAATLEAEIDDAFGAPRLDAVLKAQDIKSSDVRIKNFNANASTLDKVTTFDAEAQLEAPQKLRLTSSGQMTQNAEDIRVDIETLQAVSGQTSIRLTAPSVINIKDGETKISPTSLSVGGGTLQFEGNISEQLALEGKATNIPANIANMFVSNVDAGGQLNGDFRLSGTSEAPSATFQLNGAGLSARPLQETNVQPLSLSANGTFRNNTLQLNRALVENAQGLTLQASGNVSLTGERMDVNLNGDVPLQIAETFLQERGTSLRGNVSLRLNGTGSLKNPALGGLITLNDGTITDPLSNVRLENLSVLIGLRGNQMTLTRAFANLSGGGTLQATGRVGLSETLPANISITLDDAQYLDGELINATASGTLDITGDLTRSPLISGNILIDELEIRVPETFAENSDFLEVTPINPDALTAETLARIDAASPKPSSTSEQSDIRLNIQLNAPRRIFVRGRGLDTELGGQLLLQGTLSNVTPLGAFTLARGRLLILGKRLDFDSGQITFSGGLDPILNLVASTDAGDVDAIVTLSGSASNPAVTFTSTPELPEDEVLARIIFDRGITDLSPVQLARLASAASELAGGSGNSIVDNFRSTLGFDDLDIVNTDEGNAAVRVGKHINENVYFGVEAGQESEATINLDISEDLTARGAVNSNGDTSLGIFFERDF